MRAREKRALRAPEVRETAPSLQEWLETDGLGGFASGTAACINTRRYHGWLFLSGPGGERFLALSKIHDSVRSTSGDFDLSTSYYPGGKHPQGVLNQWFFKRDPFPSFTYSLGGRFLTREIFMEKGSPGVFCRYMPESRPWGEAVTLLARPMCNYRSYHHTARAHSWNPLVRGAGSAAVIEGHPACGSLLLMFSGATFTPDPKWYYNMIYPRETERGLDDTEDHFSPGTFTVTVSAASPGYFWAGPLPEDGRIEELARELPDRYEEARSREARRRREILRSQAGGTRYWSIPGQLAQAGDQFIVKRASGASVLAGYHWFGEWGRDTFIALPGLLLCTGRFGEAREVFLRFCDRMRGGLIPNVLDEGGESLYNSVDASLWMIEALRKYEEYSKDTAFPIALLPRLLEVIDSFLAGTLYGTRVDAGGLVLTGAPDTQVTWMDACVGGCPVTPRNGYPVEVTALFISALEAVGRWADLAGRAGGNRYRRIARRSLRSFLASFRWPGVGLYDRLNDGGPVTEIRPNQVMAAGLAGMRLPPAILRDVWETATRRLLTPRGVRTLDPLHPAYQGTYKGNPAERDASYHQGTAWPYLIGSLYDLSVKLDRAAGYGPGRGPHGALVLGRALPGIVNLDRNPCHGSVFEVASGNWPFEPGGAVAQAWSVAEALRVITEASRESQAR
ncbi:MAG: amylo-alpha-1,6-glucosidase [Bacillota bacterium]